MSRMKLVGWSGPAPRPVCTANLALLCMVALLAGVSTVAVGAQEPSLRLWQDGTWAAVVSLEEGKDYSNAGTACCMGAGAEVPLTAKYRAIRDAFVNRKNPELRTITNSATCTPPGMPGVMVHPVLFEFLMTYDRVTMVFENGEVRRIWTDGRKHPPAEELDYSFEGHSIGRWEGNTLVVDTIGISSRADVFMANGIHSTADTRVEERMYLKDSATLVVETAVTDPAIFTAPFRYRLGFKKIPGSFPVGCDANNRDNGTDTVDISLSE